MLGWLRRWRRRGGGGDGGDGGGRDDDAAGPDVDDDAPDVTGRQPALADELDLHTFLPKECADVVDEYVRAAQEAGLTAVRIVHGKGKGTLRRTVHAVLARHPAVRSYQLAEGHRGGWGATLVELQPAEPIASAPASTSVPDDR